MIVVVNASPLLALGQAQVLFILKSLFGRVYIPDTVYQETVIECNVALQKQEIVSALGDFIEVVKPTFKQSFSRNLGQGERGVLNLALERQADLVLMDDKKARNEAKELDLTCAFTTDVLKYAEQKGLIVYQRVMLHLYQANIYLP